MAQPHQQFYTVQEYLWEEQHSEEKHEYLKGHVYNMAGGSPEHSQIAFNLAAGLKRELRSKGCRAFNSDLKVGMVSPPFSTGKRRRSKGPGEDSFITYPDTSVVCGELEFFEGDRNTLANPIVLFEVVSPSTRNYDRSVKLENYQTISSLLYYVMIDSEQVKVIYYQRSDLESWLQPAPLLSRDESLSLVLPAGTITLTVAELYEEIVFEDEEE